MVRAIEVAVPTRVCDACAGAELVAFSDPGEVPVECGRHWAAESEAVASPVGRVVLGCCPACGYVRNLAFDESLVDPSAPTDMNLYHSPTFRAFSSELVAQLIAELAGRLPLAGRRVLEIGCAQGEFLRELCRAGGCTGIGYDPSYTGPTGPDPSGATLHRGPAPVPAELAPFDLLVSRFVLEHVADPVGFLAGLRSAAGEHVLGHLQVPDAEYDLATAGWEVIYPHVSYFGATALCRIATRAGWSVERTVPVFSGLIRRLDVAASSANQAGAGVSEPELRAARDRLLAAVAGFDQRHHTERRRWRETIGRLADQGARPVLWGTGSRGVQLLNYADPDHRLTATVDVNPAKWGRHLPVTGHRVDQPDRLRGSGTRAVIITNPVYRTEIAASLAGLGVDAEILVA